MNDTEIIRGILRSDENTLRYFYDLHRVALCHFIQRKIKDTYVVEEITQDVFLDFIEGLRFFKGDSTLKTFLYSIAHHKAIDHIRKKKIKKILFSAIPSFILERLAPVFLDDEIEKGELVDKINHTFEAIPHDYQVILRLKYIEGEKVEKIAKRLSMSYKATESMLFRARKAFVKAFQIVG